MKIGLLGGTFNPMHIGHLLLAEECFLRFELEKVIFIPAYIPPHKEVECGISVEDRAEMVKLGIAGNEKFELSTYEIDKKGISYTVDTLQYYREEYGDKADLFFLTGCDSVAELSTWKGVDRILDISNFIIATRPGWKKNHDYDGKVEYINIPGIDISSTVIRERIRECKSVKYLVPEPVIGYIEKKGLYKAEARSRDLQP